jgi:hypothetical protein
MMWRWSEIKREKSFAYNPFRSCNCQHPNTNSTETFLDKTNVHPEFRPVNARKQVGEGCQYRE